MLNHFRQSTVSVIGLILCAALVFWRSQRPRGETASVANQAEFASGCHLILLLDTNPYQKKVLPNADELSKELTNQPYMELMEFETGLHFLQYRRCEMEPRG